MKKDNIIYSLFTQVSKTNDISLINHPRSRKIDRKNNISFKDLLSSVKKTSSSNIKNEVLNHNQKGSNTLILSCIMLKKNDQTYLKKSCGVNTALMIKRQFTTKMLEDLEQIIISINFHQLDVNSIRNKFAFVVETDVLMILETKLCDNFLLLDIFDALICYTV